MDKDKKELMLKRAEEMMLRGKKIEDTLDLLKKQIDLLQKDKEDYKKDYINAKQEVYKDEVIERLNKELERYRNNSLQVLSDKEMLISKINKLDKNKLIAGGFTGDIDFRIAMKTNDNTVTPSITKIYILYC